MSKIEKKEGLVLSEEATSEYRPSETALAAIMSSQARLSKSKGKMKPNNQNRKRKMEGVSSKFDCKVDDNSLIVAVCKYCKEIAQGPTHRLNTTRLRNHLNIFTGISSLKSIACYKKRANWLNSKD